MDTINRFRLILVIKYQIWRTSNVPFTQDPETPQDDESNWIYMGATCDPVNQYSQFLISTGVLVIKAYL